MKLLDQKQINQKVKRLAIEILENNYQEGELYFGGINNSGYEFAKLLKAAIRRKSKDIAIHLFRIRLNPAEPNSSEISTNIDVEKLQDKCLMIVDDVANTGRTIFYAFKPFLEIIPKKVEVAVLVDRTHKRFPVKVDYMGISLATTLKDNINVKIINVEEKEVHLE
jgi:pyrimidine operon attenuation protein/uracil phosphoribosyltransferase